MMKRFFSAFLVLIVVLSLVACSGTSGAVSATDAAQAKDTAAAATADPAQQGEAPVADGFTYPLPPNADGSLVTVSMNKDDFVRADVPEYTTVDGVSYYFWDALERATGIHINFIGSASKPQATSEETMLLIASGDYPDIWRVNWITHPGGPTGAIADGLILNLSEYADLCPNLNAYVADNPEIKKLVVNDDGNLYCFPYVKDCSGMGTVGTGAAVRSDWLAEQNLELPTTIDDWTNTLRVFKEQYGCTAGLTFEARWLWLEYASSGLSSAWGVCFPFYVVDGSVKYGPLEEGYRGFVQQMADWYAEGLLDPDFATVDKSTVQAKFANSESGFAIQQCGNIENGIAANEGTAFDAVAVPTAVLNEGDTKMFGHLTAKYDGGFALSVSPGDNQEAALRLCDFFYGHEGQYLCAYGTEGITYTVDGNGEFAGFTDLVLNNTTTEDKPSSIRYNFAVNSNWAYPQLGSGIFQTDYNKQATGVWADNEMSSHFYPAVTHTEEEATVMSEVYADIETYCKEQIMMYILGTQNMDTWDDFVAQMETLGMQQVIEVKQAAYDRFNAR